MLGWAAWHGIQFPILSLENKVLAACQFAEHLICFAHFPCYIQVRLFLHNVTGGGSKYVISCAPSKAENVDEVWWL